MYRKENVRNIDTENGLFVIVEDTTETINKFGGCYCDFSRVCPVLNLCIINYLYLKQCKSPQYIAESSQITLLVGDPTCVIEHNVDRAGRLRISYKDEIEVNII